NVGPVVAIDETCLSCGELYTVVTNPSAHGGPGTLIAMIKGTDTETVVSVLEKIGLNKRKTVREVTLDLSPTMMKIARRVFPKAYLTNDRFHVQRLFYEAIDDLRITYRWMARDLENEEIKECRTNKKEYIPFRYRNGDTRRQLLARAKHILTKNSINWTESQRLRAEIIFQNYPDLHKAYLLAQKLTDIYNHHYSVAQARYRLAHWYREVEEMEYGAFRSVLNTFTNHYNTILNFFENRDTNAFAESFNAKIKAFRSQFRGVRDIPFFIYRLAKLTS
ncbi:MAG: transposase, partial [Muribaculaceae bacterium]|nr:transposase [Muribaculaceae bacterium]